MRLAYIVSRFPHASETFIARELAALESARDGRARAAVAVSRRSTRRCIRRQRRSWTGSSGPRAGEALPGARLVGAPPAAAARPASVGVVVARAPPEPRCPRARPRDRPARGGARARRAPPARRSRARALRHLPRARRLALPPADRHALQLHGARARHLRRPEHAGRGSSRTRRSRSRSPSTTAASWRPTATGRGSTSSMPASTPPRCPSGREPCRREGPVRALCVASLQEYKGHAVLLEALAGAPELERVELDLVGGGPLRAELEAPGAARSAWAGRCDSTGACARTRCATLFDRADLFVLPSVVARDGQMEGVPVVLMEALAAGVPVVATRLSGIPELVHDGETGLLAAPGDAVGAARGACAGRDRRLRARPAMPGARRSSVSSTWPTRAARLRELIASRPSDGTSNKRPARRPPPLERFLSASMTRVEPARADSSSTSRSSSPGSCLPLVPGGPADAAAATHRFKPARVVGKVVVYRLPHMQPRAHPAGAYPGARDSTARSPCAASGARSAAACCGRAWCAASAAAPGSCSSPAPPRRRAVWPAGRLLAAVRGLEPVQPHAAAEPARDAELGRRSCGTSRSGPTR